MESPPGRLPARPASPRLALAVSVVIALVEFAVAARDPDNDGRALVALAVAGTAYVLVTWPVANALFVPGRARRRSG